MSVVISTPVAAVAIAIAAAALLVAALLMGLLVGNLLVVQPSNPKPRDHAACLSRTPYWQFCLITLAMRCAYSLSWMKPAPLRVAETAVACIHSQVLFVMVNAGVAEALKDGPKTAQQLAAAAGPDTNPEWLARVLKLAAELGLVKRTKRPGLGSAPTLNPATDPSKPTQQQDEGLDVVVTDDSSGSTAVAACASDSCTPPGQPFSTGYSCNDVYSANAVTAVLCRDHPNCMVDFVKLMEDHYGPIGCMSEGVLTSRVPFKLWSGGPDFWQHIKASPRHAATFDGAMRATNHIGAKMAVQQYPWDRYNVVVDVAGGNGQFLAELLSRYPKLQGVLVDQQGQVERGTRWWAQEFSHLLPRMQFVVGDMFKPDTLPPPRPGVSTVYVLKQILHDWSDADSLAILTAIRGVISKESVSAGQASLVVLETGAMETINRPLLQHRLEADMLMLKSFGDGKERDEAQSRALLQAAGFTPGRLLPTTGLMTIQEALPAASPVMP